MSRIRIPGKLPYLRFPPYYKGAPQRRLFFPDWYIKVVRPEEKQPLDYVKFYIPHDMTKYDVKEYLEKIYNIPVAGVNLGVVAWVRYRDESQKWCFMDPWKIAHVRLGKGQIFKFPELLPKEKEDDQLNTIEAEEKRQQMMKQMREPAGEEDIRAKLTIGNKWFG